MDKDKIRILFSDKLKKIGNLELEVDCVVDMPGIVVGIFDAGGGVIRCDHK
jgi:hypothetical protein